MRISIILYVIIFNLTFVATSIDSYSNLLVYKNEKLLPKEVNKCSILKIKKIEQTVLFKEGENGLMQAVDISIVNNGQRGEASLKVRYHSHEELNINLDIEEKGEATYRFFIPEIQDTIPVEFIIQGPDNTEDYLEINWKPQKHWEVCLVPISHHDLGYTAPIEMVLNQYNDIYDDVIDFCKRTDDCSYANLYENVSYPDEAKYRYSVEASWSLQNFISKRNEDTKYMLAKYIAEGRIDIHALYGNMVTGMCGHEEIIRTMYPSFKIAKEFGGHIKVASITDIPGFSWALPTVLSGAGVKYFFAGLPTYFEWGSGKYKDKIGHTFWDEKKILRPYGRPDAFYWKGPDGSKILVYYQGGYGCWSPKTYDEIMNELPDRLNEMKDSPLSVVRYAGYGCGDNTPTTSKVSMLVKEWNSKWAYPKLIVSTSTMFFEKLAKKCGEDIRTFSGDLPGTDYTVGALSTAMETTKNRRTHDEIHSAEKLATMSHILLDDSNYPSDVINEAYNSMMLYDEHSWGMYYSGGNVPEWSYADKSNFAYKASGLTELLLSGMQPKTHKTFATNARNIAHSIEFNKEGRHIVVFNTLSFTRNDLVEITDFDIKEPFEIVDAETGESVAHQIVQIKSPHSPVLHASERYARRTSFYDFNAGSDCNLVFVAENVPSMGYKTYRIVTKNKKISENSTSLLLSDSVIENRFYKVKLNSLTGTIESIFDKEYGRELVDQYAQHQVNQMITRWVETGKVESPQYSTIKKNENGPVVASVVVSSGVSGCPQLTQEIKLYDKIKRIDIANRILKDKTPNMEVYFAFPFMMKNPDFRYEGPLSVIKPLRDQFPGSNSNYYSVQHWANVSDGDLGITLAPVDAHMVEFGGLHPTVVSQAHHVVAPVDYLGDFTEEMKKGHMYSFVINSNYQTNFPPSQLGDILYRYSITTNRGNWIACQPRDFGWAASNPLLAVQVAGKDEGPLPPYRDTAEKKNEILPESLSFCTIDKSNVILMTLKKAEDNNGIIVRLNETEGQNTKVVLKFPYINIKKVYKTNLVEVNKDLLEIDNNTLKIDIKPFGIQTIRVII